MNTTQLSYMVENMQPQDEGDAWRTLLYYNLYRMALSLALFALLLYRPNKIEFDAIPSLLVPALFIGITPLIIFITIKLRKPSLPIQAHIVFALDIACITVLFLSHHLNNVSTVVLMMTIIAASSVIFRLSIALVYACLGSLIIMGHSYLGYIIAAVNTQSLAISAVAATGFLAIALTISLLATRFNQANIRLKQQKTALADLTQINKLIINRLDMGIAFFDHNKTLRLVNRQAKRLLKQIVSWEKVEEHLAELIDLNNTSNQAEKISLKLSGHMIDIHKIPLRKGLLLRVEDRSQIEYKMQQSKLASVGRMAAAISHEIRNPLHAINHAAQLLKPDDQDPEAQELIRIIRHHCGRIDRIIESVLQQSKSGQMKPEQIQLKPWLENFTTLFSQSIIEKQIKINICGPHINIMFNPGQLEQVCTNLLQNSIKYGMTPQHPLEINLAIGQIQASSPFLDVSDNGPGIGLESRRNLFEPFYTSDSRSTGLGLFLVREICHSNEADIEYREDENGEKFRIFFQPPKHTTSSEPPEANKID